METPWPDYSLIDFGDGRKLERFAGLVTDRASPPAGDFAKNAPAAWKTATARYTGSKVGDGKWKFAAGALPARFIQVPLTTKLSFQLTLELTPAGQVGLFPEQFTNWHWIARQVAQQGVKSNRPLRLLNLFAYTGGSTLAAAVAGAEVTHVDASKPAVALARENAGQSGLAEAPIRWIVEDVLKYCTREVKRDSRYDAVILDPPTYGHGPKGEEWRITRDLPKLLELCAELTDRTPSFLLTTCHSLGIGPAELSAYLSDAIIGHCGQPPASGKLTIAAKDGRQLPSGIYARWPQ